MLPKKNSQREITKMANVTSSEGQPLATNLILCDSVCPLDIDHQWISDKSIPLCHPLLHLFHPKVSGDDLLSALKLSRSFVNSDLRHLRHSSDSDCLPVLETLQSTSCSEPLPAVPNAITHSFHSDPSPDTPSKGCSESSTSSEGDPV